MELAAITNPIAVSITPDATNTFSHFSIKPKKCNQNARDTQKRSKEKNAMRPDRDWIDVLNLVILVAAFLAAAAAAQQAERLATATLDATAHYDFTARTQHLDTVAAIQKAEDANVLAKDTAERQAKDTDVALALSNSPLTKSGSSDSLRLRRFGRVIGDGDGAVGGGSGRLDGDVGGRCLARRDTRSTTGCRRCCGKPVSTRSWSRSASRIMRRGWARRRCRRDGISACT